jgi:hypothetical protein
MPRLKSKKSCKCIKQDKEGHSILIKGEIHQKEITIITQRQCTQFHQKISPLS